MAKVSDVAKADKELNHDEDGTVAALVPVKMLKSDAALGLRAGEIRGVSAETAERMIALKSAEAVPTKEIDAAAKKAAADEAAAKAAAAGL